MVRLATGHVDYIQASADCTRSARYTIHQGRDSEAAHILCRSRQITTQRLANIARCKIMISVPVPQLLEKKAACKSQEGPP